MECTHLFLRYTDGTITPKSGELCWRNKLFKYSTLESLIDMTDRFKLKNYKFKLVPCGHCVACNYNKSKTWAIRCLNELETSNNAYFITLTYDDDHLPLSNSISTGTIRTFLSSLRKSINRYLYKNKINNYPDFKYYAVGEYGTESGRPHYHLIVFNVPFEDFSTFFPLENGRFERKYSKDGELMFHSDTISKLWSRGFVQIGKVNHKSCSYVCGYVDKKRGQYNDNSYFKRGLVPPFAIMSRGIGFQYFLDNYKKITETDEIFYQRGDLFMSVPIPQAYLVKLKKLDRKLYDYVMNYRDNKSNAKIRQVLSMSKVELVNYFKTKRLNNIEKVSSFTRGL